MPYQSKAQQRFFHARLPEHAHKWDQATKRKKHGFQGLPERVDKLADYPTKYKRNETASGAALGALGGGLGAGLGGRRGRGRYAAIGAGTGAIVGGATAHRAAKKKLKVMGAAERQVYGKADVADAFGVSRPDLVAKARPGLNSPEAKRQRRHVALSTAVPYVGGLTGPAIAAHYAPSGHKGSSAARATGRGVGEGTLGATGGAALGSLAARGRPLGAQVGAAAGALAGASHGTAMSMKTTQRKYGVQHR